MTSWRSRAFIVKQYLHYWLAAIDQYSLHTPFAYQFYKSVVLEDSKNTDFSKIEGIRRSLLKNRTKIKVHDLGAGSVFNTGNIRTISDISRSSLSTSKFSRFLFRLLRQSNPSNVLELGTSLGINTAYMAKANPSVSVYTLEGCPNISGLARKHFDQLQLENIEIITGNIDDTLPGLLKSINTAAFVFFDANHTEEATLQYFEMCLRHKSEDSIFVFDDIHLSNAMHRAWEKIRTHEEVTHSMDIFDAGIVFFKKGLQPGHYTLSF